MSPLIKKSNILAAKRNWYETWKSRRNWTFCAEILPHWVAKIFEGAFWQISRRILTNWNKGTFLVTHSAKKRGNYSPQVTLLFCPICEKVISSVRFCLLVSLSSRALTKEATGRLFLLYSPSGKWRKRVMDLLGSSFVIFFFLPFFWRGGRKSEEFVIIYRQFITRSGSLYLGGEEKIGLRYGPHFGPHNYIIFSN